jgi:hypothetical protein
MSHTAGGPADANRWAVLKLKWNFPIVPSLHPERKYFLRRIAIICRESVTSQVPTVMGLSLQIRWRHLGKILHKGAE